MIDRWTFKWSITPLEVVQYGISVLQRCTMSFMALLLMWWSLIIFPLSHFLTPLLFFIHYTLSHIYLIRTLSSLFTTLFIFLFIARKTFSSINSGGFHLIWYTQHTRKYRVHSVCLKESSYKLKGGFFCGALDWTLIQSCWIIFLWRLLYPGWEKSTAGPVKTFDVVGLNLLKQSDISAPHPEEIFFLILF